LSKHGSRDEAVGLFRDALQAHPQWPEALINLGDTLHLLGRQTEALKAYEDALNIDSTRPDLHIRLGITYLSLHEPARAEEALRQAILINPDGADARYYLGLALLSDGRLQEALSESQGLEAIDKKKAADLRERIREQSRRR
jgi:tetratricopeptide (TPR) repeat protein